MSGVGSDLLCWRMGIGGKEAVGDAEAPDYLRKSCIASVLTPDQSLQWWRCRDLKVQGGAVFWPVRAQMPEAGWIHASDHRPVYLDVEVCADAGPAAAI